MAADDLNTPLGMSKAPRRKRGLPDPMSALAAIVLGLAFAVTVWIIATDNPLGGEPVARVAIKHEAPQPPAGAEAPQTAATAAQDAPPAIPEAAGGQPGPLIIKVPRSGSAVAAAEEIGSEASRHGNLPRIADDGRRPMDVFARTTRADAARPRMALIVSGLGISAAASADAIRLLPLDVTLAFTPYSETLADLATDARRRGFEILLQVPMEPFDYPNNDPGPQTLLSDLPVSANIDRLHWSMSRASGYAGVSSYMGQRFTSSDPALHAVLTEIARRGLFFVDNGQQPGSRSVQIGRDAGALVIEAGIALGGGTSISEIDAALARAEAQARTTGSAIAMIPIQPDLLGHLGNWATGLAQRGIALVPASDLVRRPPEQRKSPS